MRKKILMRAGCCVIAAALLTASAGSCGKNRNVKQQRTQISIWCYWEMEYNRKILNTLVNEYNHDQDKVELTVEYIPDDDFKKQLILSMADQETPDMAMVDISDFPYLHSIDDFVDLTEEIPELVEYMPVALDACTVDDRIYGLPVGLNCSALVYNKTMLEEASLQPPSTLEELVSVAEALTNKDVQGIGINALSSEESTYVFLPFLWSNGADINHLNSPASVEVFQTFRQLRDLGIITDFADSFTIQDIIKQFQKKKVAMMVSNSDCLNPLRRETPQIDFDVTEIPGNGQSVSTIGGEIMAVFHGENQDACIDFLRYMADQDRMQTYLEQLGYLAPREDILEQQYQNDPQGQKYIEIFRNAETREKTVDWPQISKVVGGAMQDSLHQEKEVESIAEEAAGKIAEIRKSS